MARPTVPPAYEFLWNTHTETGKPVRYYVIRGGRGKGATWSIARKLIYKAHTQPSLILCTRDVQLSIKDSVHRVLKSQIKKLGFSEFFTITANSIKSNVTDSEFLFRGLNDLTADDIKSMEGITDVWVAEAEKMGQRAWDVLDPTIREEGSHIYVDYNPKKKKSPTNVMFTVNCPSNALVRHINFDQNPFFPAVLETQRQQALAKIENAPNPEARKVAQEKYNHVWLGACEEVSAASILGSQFRVDSFTPKIDEGKWDGPYDGADWGFGSDPTVRIRVWIWTKPTGTKWLCIEQEVVLRGPDGNDLELRHLPAEFDKFPNSRTVRIRADCSQPQTIRWMKNERFNIIGADKWPGSVEDGIQHIRGAYDGIIVHPRCPVTAEECEEYSYKVDRLTGDVLADIVDAHNHCIDAIRYAIQPLIQTKRGGRTLG